MTTLPAGYDLLTALMGLELPRALVERAHLAAQAALLAEGFTVCRELRAELSAEEYGPVLSAGALVHDPFTEQQMLLRTDLFMTSVPDSYGCTYLSWVLHFADEGPQQAVQHRALGLRNIWEGPGVDPGLPAYDAQRALMTTLSRALTGEEALDLDSMAVDFARKVGSVLTL